MNTKFLWLGISIMMALLGVSLDCSKSNPVASPPSYNVLESSTETISTTSGGFISVPGGSYVVIAPGTFPTDTTMTLSLLSTMNKQCPNGLVQSVGTSLVLSFGGTVKPTSGGTLARRMAVPVPTSGLELVIAYDSAMTSLVGSDPMADVVDLSGSHNFIGIPGAYDPISNTATFTVQLPIIHEMASISVGQANFNPVITGAVAPRFGPRIWNGSVWVAFPQGFDRTRNTLVMVHGIMSNVEMAFGSCVNDIMTAGGYGQIIGFDYDWTKSANEEGTLLANFLDSLKYAGLPQVDIEAHSLGGLVSLDALSKSGIKVNNLITEGTPFSGTPIASMAISAEAENNYISPWLTYLYNMKGVPNLSNYFLLTSDQRDAIDNELGQLGIPVNITTVHDLYKAGLTNGFVNDLSTGSKVVNQVLSGPNPPNFIRVVGLKNSMPIEVNGWLFNGKTNDTYVPSTSAAGNGLGLPGPSPLYFNEEHEELECNPDVIKEVGIAVKNGTPVTCTYSISSLGQTFGSIGGSGTVTVTTGSDCAWTAEVDNADWITVTSNSDNSGSGMVNFSVQANTTPDQRIGEIFIAGKSFSITQDGSLSTANAVGTYVNSNFVVGRTVTCGECTFENSYAGTFIITITGGEGFMISPYTGTMTWSTTIISTLLTASNNCRSSSDSISISGMVSGSSLKVEGLGTLLYEGFLQMTMTFSNGTLSGDSLTGTLIETETGGDGTCSMPPITSTITLHK